MDRPWKVKFLDFKTWNSSVKKNHFKYPGFWDGFLRQTIYLFIVCKHYVFDLLHFLQDLLDRMRPSGHESPGEWVNNFAKQNCPNLDTKNTSFKIRHNSPYIWTLSFKGAPRFRFSCFFHISRICMQQNVEQLPACVTACESSRDPSWSTSWPTSVSRVINEDDLWVDWSIFKLTNCASLF